MKKFLIIGSSFVNVVGSITCFEQADSHEAFVSVLDNQRENSNNQRIIFKNCYDDSIKSVKINLGSRIESFKALGMKENAIKEWWAYKFAASKDSINQKDPHSVSLTNLAKLINFALMGVFPDNPGAVSCSEECFRTFDKRQTKPENSINQKKGRKHFLQCVINSCAPGSDNSGNPTSVKVSVLGLLNGWLCFETLCDMISNSVDEYETKEQLNEAYSNAITTIINELTNAVNYLNTKVTIAIMQNYINQQIASSNTDGSLFSDTDNFNTNVKKFMRHDWNCYLVQTGVICPIKYIGKHSTEKIYPENVSGDGDPVTEASTSALSKCIESVTLRAQLSSQEQTASVSDVYGVCEFRSESYNQYISKNTPKVETNNNDNNTNGTEFIFEFRTELNNKNPTDAKKFSTSTRVNKGSNNDNNVEGRGKLSQKGTLNYGQTDPKEKNLTEVERIKAKLDSERMKKESNNTTKIESGTQNKEGRIHVLKPIDKKNDSNQNHGGLNPIEKAKQKLKKTSNDVQLDNNNRIESKQDFFDKVGAKMRKKPEENNNNGQTGNDKKSYESEKALLGENFGVKLTGVAAYDNYGDDNSRSQFKPYKRSNNREEGERLVKLRQIPQKAQNINAEDNLFLRKEKLKKIDKTDNKKDSETKNSNNDFHFLLNKRYDGRSGKVPVTEAEIKAYFSREWLYEKDPNNDKYKTNAKNHTLLLKIYHKPSLLNTYGKTMEKAIDEDLNALNRDKPDAMKDAAWVAFYQYAENMADKKAKRLYGKIKELVEIKCKLQKLQELQSQDGEDNKGTISNSRPLQKTQEDKVLVAGQIEAPKVETIKNQINELRTNTEINTEYPIIENSSNNIKEISSSETAGNSKDALKADLLWSLIEAVVAKARENLCASIQGPDGEFITELNDEENNEKSGKFGNYIIETALIDQFYEEELEEYSVAKQLAKLIETTKDAEKMLIQCDELAMEFSKRSLNVVTKYLNTVSKKISTIIEHSKTEETGELDRKYVIRAGQTCFSFNENLTHREEELWIETASGLAKVTMLEMELENS